MELNTNNLNKSIPSALQNILNKKEFKCMIFQNKKAMLEVTLELLKENSLLEISSLGGGTALAGYYWNHRYSTDIDIFIYGNENKTHLLKPSNWSENIKSKMNYIGFTGNFRHNDIYTEIVIDRDSKFNFLM